MTGLTGRKVEGSFATHPDQLQAGLAEASYRQALALAEPRCMRPLIARCYLGLGELHRRVGRCEEARTALATAVAAFCEMGMMFWLSTAEDELARIGVSGGSL